MEQTKIKTIRHTTPQDVVLHFIELTTKNKKLTFKVSQKTFDDINTKLIDTNYDSTKNENYTFI